MKKLTYPNIEAERARKGYTIEELSKLLGVTRKTYYNWVCAGKIPQSKIELMSDIFDSSVDYLLGKNPILRQHKNWTEQIRTDWRCKNIFSLYFLGAIGVALEIIALIYTFAYKNSKYAISIITHILGVVTPKS